MKFLHTSDWHIGRTLYGRKRYDEFKAFLHWLSDLIEAESIELLLVCGDIFDTTTPGNRAQELYYQFLCRTALSSCCRHVVITAGNHDSPSFLNAPKALLKALNVHVIGAASEAIEDEVLLLCTPSGNPELIVCAVPYLRDRDLRNVEAGESPDEKQLKLLHGIQAHYEKVVDHACQLRNKTKIPIIAMGHLFTAGGKTQSDDGVRDLYVGNLAHVGRDAFPDAIDYLALGHLHIPQKVGKQEHIRYCGSPLPMGFGEARQQKKVIVVELQAPHFSPSHVQLPSGAHIETPSDTDTHTIRPPVTGLADSTPAIDLNETMQSLSLKVNEIHVPTFQPMAFITGTMEEIIHHIDTLKSQSRHAWLEIEYTGTELIPNLRELLESEVEHSGLDILKIKNRQLAEQLTLRGDSKETLEDLDEQDVFIRCLDQAGIDDAQRRELLQSYREIVTLLREQDRNIE